MFFIGTDTFAGDGTDTTFTANIKSIPASGQVVVKVYATSGMTAKRMYPLSFKYSSDTAGWFAPIGVSTAAASQQGLPGIASAAIASGCVGWVTVRGPVTAASSKATDKFTGECGHAVFWGGATGMAASSSAYIGALHQIGFLLTSATGGAAAANIFLTGNEIARSI